MLRAALSNETAQRFMLHEGRSSPSHLCFSSCWSHSNGILICNVIQRCIYTIRMQLIVAQPQLFDVYNTFSVFTDCDLLLSIFLIVNRQQSQFY